MNVDVATKAVASEPLLDAWRTHFELADAVDPRRSDSIVGGSIVPGGVHEESNNKSLHSYGPTCEFVGLHVLATSSTLDGVFMDDIVYGSVKSRVNNRHKLVMKTVTVTGNDRHKKEPESPIGIDEVASMAYNTDESKKTTISALAIVLCANS